MIPPTAAGAGRPMFRRGALCARLGAVPSDLPLTRACAAASQTVSLVLAQDAPLPDSDRDVNDLVYLLRGHVAQLGALTAPDNPSLLHAQQLCSDCIPEDYVPSRVYLVRLAEATHDLVAHVERDSPEPISAEGGRRWRRPTVNVLRGAVFVLALACLIFAASVPRT